MTEQLIYPYKVLGLEITDLQRILTWIKEQGYSPYDVDSLIKCDIINNERFGIKDEG